MLSIRNLHVSSEGIPILKGLSLEVKEGEIHAIMGPNGAGKSTLAKVLAGHPCYEVTEGEIIFEGKDLLELEPEERAHLGLFMSFQYPPELAGVSNEEFLFQAFNSKKRACKEAPISAEEFKPLLEEKCRLVEMRRDFLTRNLNEGFSGGEKKRNEILQMALLEPKLAILDETDSGLDIDALRNVAQGINLLMDGKRALILITHYQRLLDYISPHYVHMMVEGAIVRSGEASLALELEEKGYEALLK